MIGNAQADRDIFLAALGRSGLTWVQSTAVFIAKHGHKRKIQVCKECFDAFADYKIIWRSVGRKYYTKYYCAQCIRQRVGDYFSQMIRDLKNLRTQDHESRAMSILLAQDQVEQDDYREHDIVDIAKYYLKKLEHDREIKDLNLDRIKLHNKVMRCFSKKSTLTYDELKEKFPEIDSDDLIDTLTELLTDGRLYEPRHDHFRVIA